MTTATSQSTFDFAFPIYSSTRTKTGTDNVSGLPSPLTPPVPSIMTDSSPDDPAAGYYDPIRDRFVSDIRSRPKRAASVDSGPRRTHISHLRSTSANNLPLHPTRPLPRPAVARPITTAAAASTATLTTMTPTTLPVRPPTRRRPILPRVLTTNEPPPFPILSPITAHSPRLPFPPAVAVPPASPMYASAGPLWRGPASRPALPPISLPPLLNITYPRSTAPEPQTAPILPPILPPIRRLTRAQRSHTLPTQPRFAPYYQPPPLTPTEPYCRNLAPAQTPSSPTSPDRYTAVGPSTRPRTGVTPGSATTMYVSAVPSNPRLRHYTIDDRFPMHRFKQERASLTLYPAEDAELRAHYEAQIYGKGLSKIANNLSVYQALRNRSLNRDSKGFIRSCAITPRVENKEQIVAYYETDLESGIRVRIIYDPRDPDFNIQGQLDAIGPVIFLTTFGYLFNGSGRMLLYKNLRFIQELNGNRQPESQLPDLLASLDEIKRIYENRPHSLSKSAYKKKYRSRNP